MQNKRHNARFDSKELCELYWNGSFHMGVVEDLSIVGMGVHILDAMPDVEIGDECRVYLDDGMIPNEYSCMIKRISNSDIALKITSVQLPEHIGNESSYS
jgi:hypothetical protein